MGLGVHHRLRAATLVCLVAGVCSNIYGACVEQAMGSPPFVEPIPGSKRAREIAKRRKRQKRRARKKGGGEGSAAVSSYSDYDGAQRAGRQAAMAASAAGAATVYLPPTLPALRPTATHPHSERH